MADVFFCAFPSLICRRVALDISLFDEFIRIRWRRKNRWKAISHVHTGKKRHTYEYIHIPPKKKNTNSFDHHYKPFFFIYSVFVVFVFQPPVFSLCFDFVAFSICYFHTVLVFLYLLASFSSLFFVCMWLWYFTAIWICHIGSEMNKY